MNHTTIEELTENCTVKIRILGRQNTYGTGFFIAPGYIVTCAHVLKQSLDKKIICSLIRSDRELPARLVHSFSPEIDLAILETNPTFTHPCVLIGCEINFRDDCFAFGYTDSEGGNPDGDPVTLECEGFAGRQRELIKVKGGQVRPGMSGAPLLNQRTGKICGVINKSRNRQIDLGGEALSPKVIFEKFPALKEVHDYFHRTNNDWTNYLQENVEPFPSDWNRLDRNDKKWSSYLKALCFLLSVLFKWIILGLRAPRAFPVETINLLIKHTLTGDLGHEINKQRKELVKDLSKVDFEAGGQARIINQLESKASILSEVITILVLDSRDLASSSRLLWAVELIYEQQDLLNDLKELKGNSYPNLENWKKRFGFLRTTSDRRYREVDKIINKLLLKYPNNELGLTNQFHVILWDLLDFFSENPILGMFLFSEMLGYLKKMFSQSETDRLNEEDEGEENDYAVLVKSVLEELEGDIKKYPHLKVLSKTKVLLESVAGKPVVGGPYRAWGKSKTKNKYHFSRKCKFYPERARPHEMNKISCYNSHAEARQKHEPCKTCISAENIKSMDFIGDESS
ncbi:serine protease [Leptothoe sp. ISB3NOV94-8A]